MNVLIVGLWETKEKIKKKSKYIKPLHIFNETNFFFNRFRVKKKTQI